MPHVKSDSYSLIHVLVHTLNIHALEKTSARSPGLGGGQGERRFKKPALPLGRHIHTQLITIIILKEVTREDEKV